MKKKTWKDYFRDAAELRVALERNIDDFNFASKRNGRIVYVLDANIVQLFLNPSRESKLIAAFDTYNYTKHLRATAIITAEFIFSRHLAGQRGATPFITLSHVEDLSSMMEHVERQLKLSKKSIETTPLNLLPEHRKQLDDLVSSVQKNDISLTDGLDELRKKLPSIAEHLLQGPIYEANNFSRLYREDLLRPLALDPLATQDILYPDKNLINAWKKRIEKQRRPDIGSKNARNPLDKDKLLNRIERDAKSLVQVILLNKNAENEITPTQYVMITADLALHRAYSLWFWGDYDKPSSAYVLRHPLQYIPMLNIQEMPNIIDHSDLIIKTKDVLESLLCNIRDKDPRYPYILSYYLSIITSCSCVKKSAEELKFITSLQQRFKNDVDVIEGEPSLLNELITKWQYANDNLILMNSDLIKQRAETEFRQLSILLRTHHDIQNALITYQAKMLEELEATHIALNIRSNLIEISKINQKIANSVNEISRVPLLLIRTEFSEFTNKLPLNEYLDNFFINFSNSSGSINLHMITDQLIEKNQFRATFFAACVAFRVGLWPAAHYYGKRAFELVHRAKDDIEDADRYELYYLIALAMRLTFNDLEDFENAKDILKDVEKYHTSVNDVFGLVRSISEQAALYLFLLYRIKILPRNSKNLNHYPEDHLIETAKYLLCNSRQQLLNLQNVDALIPICLQETIAVQIFANIISAEIYARHFSSYGKLFSIDELFYAINKIKYYLDKKQIQCPKIVRAELIFLCWDLEKDVKKRSIFYNELCSICSLIEHNSQLTEVDIAECHKLLDIIKKSL